MDKPANQRLALQDEDGPTLTSFSAFLQRIKLQWQKLEHCSEQWLHEEGGVLAFQKVAKKKKKTAFHNLTNWHQIWHTHQVVSFKIKCKNINTPKCKTVLFSATHATHTETASSAHRSVKERSNQDTTICLSEADESPSVTPT